MEHGPRCRRQPKSPQLGFQMPHASIQNKIGLELTTQKKKIKSQREEIRKLKEDIRDLKSILADAKSKGFTKTNRVNPTEAPPLKPRF
jgi:hypothetical protein